MKGIYYSRGLVVWISIGILLLDAFLITQLITTPFDWSYLFLGWLILGAHVVTGYGLFNLWDHDITVI